MKKLCFQIVLVVTFSHCHILTFAQKVGIGTLTPAGKLHLKGSEDVSQLIIEANSTQSNINPLIKFRKSDGTDLMWIHSDDSTNTFLGLKAGRVNVIGPQGINNTFIGSRAGYSNTNGRDNTVVGTNALFSNIKAGRNIAIGTNALFTLSFSPGGTFYQSNNVAVGYEALYANQSTNSSNGVNNTAVGTSALRTNITGAKNTAIGYNADVSSDNLSNATAIGYNAKAAASNTLILGGTGADAVNVGIGTTTPGANLDVIGTLKVADGTQGAGKILTSDAAGLASWQSPPPSSTGDNIGFGVWGDCATNGNISGYCPVVDTTGAIDDNFGYTVSISGNYAIVGAYLDDGVLGADQGSASIYQFNGTNWVVMQKLTDAAGAAFDYFGESVSISGNYAIVGAYPDDGVLGQDQGSASIYQLSGGTWVLMQKLTDATGAAADFFGDAVSISGSYAIVGASGDDGAGGASQGSASIYQLSGGTWVLMNKITDATGAANDFFGTTVSISGIYAIVGAPNDDVGANANQGSASIYQLSGGIWVLMNKITDATSADSDFFGTGVSISGTYAIIGANYDDIGANSNQGSASIYHLSGGVWTLINKITNSTGIAEDRFGASVSISGNYAIVGSDGYDGVGGLNQGSATIYQKVGLGWQKLQDVIDPGGNANEEFGFITAFDNSTKRFVIGAYLYGGQSGKAIFGKVN